MDIEIPDGLIPFIIVCLVAAWWAWGMLRLLVDALQDYRRYRRLRRRHGKAAARAMMARARKARGEDDFPWDDDEHEILPCLTYPGRMMTFVSAGELFGEDDDD